MIIFTLIKATIWKYDSFSFLNFHKTFVRHDCLSMPTKHSSRCRIESSILSAFLSVTQSLLGLKFLLSFLKKCAECSRLLAVDVGTAELYLLFMRISATRFLPNLANRNGGAAST